MRSKLILFTRYPVAGETKTRLIPALGPEGAARVQHIMTAHAAQTARALAARGGTHLEIRYTGTFATAMKRWIGKGFSLQAQGDGNLGDRLHRAATEAFVAGYDRVTLIGCDCPALDATLLREAFASLDQADLVLGPAADGGYYLLALKKPHAQLFDNIPWGEDTVLKHTLRAAEGLGLRHRLLTTLSDIDRPEDLPLWESCQQVANRLAVVVPTLNESAHLEETLDRITAGNPDEVIVVDAGSDDATAELARSRGARVLMSPKGRARQLNAGAAATTSPFLLFLHADTLLPDDYKHLILQTLTDPDVAAGAFTFALREPIPHRRLLEHLVALRCRWLNNPFGDQGLFVKRDLFEAIDGFPPGPILEDVEIVRQLKLWGRLVVHPTPAYTSGRRWVTHGIWRTLSLNLLIMLAYYSGVPKERLAKWRRRC